MPRGGKKGEVPQCTQTNPLQGSTQSKVLQLGLNVHADELRAAGYSLTDIAKQLNENYLADSDYKLSTMSLQRYFAKYSEVKAIDNRMKPEEALNIASELRMLYDVTIDLLESIQLSIAEAKKVKDYKAIQGNAHLAEKLTARAQGLLQTTSDMMSKMYTYAALNRVITIMFNVIEENAGIEVAAKIKLRMQENPELWELTKKVKDT